MLPSSTLCQSVLLPVNAIGNKSADAAGGAGSVECPVLSKLPKLKGLAENDALRAVGSDRRAIQQYAQFRVVTEAADADELTDA